MLTTFLTTNLFDLTEGNYPIISDFTNHFKIN